MAQKTAIKTINDVNLMCLIKSRLFNFNTKTLNWYSVVEVTFSVKYNHRFNCFLLGGIFSCHLFSRFFTAKCFGEKVYPLCQ